MNEIEKLYEKILDNQDWEMEDLDRLMELVREERDEHWRLSTKKSPWISVNERVPDEGQKVFVLIFRDGMPHTREEKFYRKIYINLCAKWVHSNSRVLAWMPIPSFDEILEANKDVLERIREKGD